MIAMHKNQHSLHNKNPQKQQLTASKTIEINVSKGFDGVRKFTLKFTTNPINGSEANKRGLRYTMCPKAM